MVLLKSFVVIVILALSHFVTASPAQQCQKAECQKEQCQKKKSDKGPIPRIHKISSVDLASYNGAAVPYARPFERRSRFIVGKDDRKEWANKKYPFNVVREIRLGEKVCTGTAVGPRHLMTAQHCFPTKPVPIKIKFKDGKDHVSYAIDVIVSWPEHKQCRGTDDFAILIFDRPIFEKDGYFGAKKFDCKKNTNKPIYKHAGFPVIDRKVERLQQNNIKVTMCNICDQTTQLATDTDVDRGQSGGPLFRTMDGAAWQYGVLSGYQRRVGSIFTSGRNFVNVIAYAREKYL
ncbi:trypsin serine protease protein [Fusarium langsethiae]|uniref:Trypsin serine protease protein n=1 Tax=Fusarium langsethiae TaxID=179993 RepID=A0A0M9EPG6_FUSLA|nr:trypsin serine protease protein [Fusarium langsethiae]GKU07064.1 unnamed protein product [Fusarium langsethiae]